MNVRLVKKRCSLQQTWTRTHQSDRLQKWPDKVSQKVNFEGPGLGIPRSTLAPKDVVAWSPSLENISHVLGRIMSYFVSPNKLT